MPVYLPAAVLSLAVLWLGAARADDRPVVDVAIVFVADTSNSIRTAERYLERRSHADALLSEPVQSAIADTQTGAIAAAYVEFGSQAWVRVGWTKIDGIAPAKAFGAAVLAADYATDGWTGIGAGLDVANSLFTTLPFRAQRLVVDVIGNGDNNYGEAVAPPRAALIARGVTINGMPMIRDPADADLVPYYASMITGGPGHFSVPLTVFADMPEALRKKIPLELY
jgi:hypothetical protein